MYHLPRGLYQTLLTRRLAEQLRTLPSGLREATRELRKAELPDRLAWHVGRLVLEALEGIPEAERLQEGPRLIGRLITTLAETRQDLRWSEDDLLPEERPRLLEAIRSMQPSDEPEDLKVPLVPLLDTTLLTHAPGEPRLQSQLQSEIHSADRIDLIVAFIRRTGLLPLAAALEAHVEAGRPLRVLTTTYTGTTELAALEHLRSMGAQVKVSYDHSAERLHAKAWLFHRASGFGTAFIGSSNMTHQAQVTGLEWNVRVAQARNPEVIAKMAAAFESHWEGGDFELFDAADFRARVASQRKEDGQLLLSPVELRPEPFQARMLEQLAVARLQGHHRNLLVSATGTGKTVMAALDYVRLRTQLARARLLFVAHRQEILDQSLRTFRHALGEAYFGELWVGGTRPTAFTHVFASIQSLNASSLEHLARDHFDVVIIDEFHHAAAASYRRLLDHLRPKELLGLTATPERADGQDITSWFGGRVAAEMRLWDAIDQRRLVPFAYYGLQLEGMDFRDVAWRRQGGYDAEGLTRVLTADDALALQVLRELDRLTEGARDVRALGFCVSVSHARFMARIFRERGVAATALWGETPEDERRQALQDLAAGRLAVIFSVDLFNEGVDIPEVDTLLLLRPTDSPVLFLQQLGRGLRRPQGPWSPGRKIKTHCTVLDFVGQHRREFRLERRYQALLGCSRSTLRQHLEEDFPYLPAGCHLVLDPIARETVLTHLKAAVPSRWAAKARELAEMTRAQGPQTLTTFLAHTGLELPEIYDGQGHGWSRLQEEASIPLPPAGPLEDILREACSRLLHVDDVERLDTWLKWLERPQPPDVTRLSPRERRLLRMLTSQMLGSSKLRGEAYRDLGLEEGARLIWQHPRVWFELRDLLPVLRDRISHVTYTLTGFPDLPLQVHARYARVEIMAAFGEGRGARSPLWQTGVHWQEAHRCDLLAFTLDKDTGYFSPTTRYRDYAISREFIHWESQSTTRAESRTGRRYQHHQAMGSHVLLFARMTQDDAFSLLGTAQYVRHTGERPMAITWKLDVPLPGDLYQAYRAVGG